MVKLVLRNSLSVGQIAVMLFAWAMLVAMPAARGATFTAKLDRNTAAIGETVTLSLSFSGGAPASQPQLPTIPGLQFSGGVSASQSFSIINGTATQQTTYDYVLLVQKVGEINIPAIKAVVDGATLTSSPLKLIATQPTPVAASKPDGSPSEAFVKLVTPKTNVYVGEVIPVEFQLFYQAARDAHLPQVSAEGFTMSQIPQRPEQTQTQVNGMAYNVATFRFSASPIRPGSLNLGPASVVITILSDPRRDFFGQTVFRQARQTTLASEPLTIQALPLPTAGKPATFNGAIGAFQMNLSASPTTVAVGDPITLKIEISGRGALEPLSLPPQPAWREFKMYTPSSKVETTDPLGLEGKKVFDLVISPQNAAIKELPPFQFSFFDPAQKSYRTLTSQAIALNVTPTAATPQPTVVSANTQPDEPQQTKEIVHIKAQLGTLHAPGKPLLMSPAFWAIPALAPVLWIGAMIHRRRKESFANNPRLRRKLEVERTVRDGLLKLKEQAEANKAEEFFATVFRLLQEQIGERLDAPASSITEAVVEDDLKMRGAKPETLKLVHELFQTCNQARYAPVRGSQQLASFIPKVEQALAELKALPAEKMATTPA